MLTRITRFARVFFLSPAEVWAMTLQEFFVFVQELTNLEAAHRSR